MHGLDNLMKRSAERVLSTKAPPQMGIISSYDPDQYAAKVILQPSGVETGFIQIRTEWIGLYAAPNNGEIVEVHFQEWGKGAPYITGRFYGNKFPPRPVPAGEFHLYHATGSLMKLTSDGRVTVADKSGSAFILNADGTAILNANLIVNGQIQATEDIIDFYTTNGSSMRNFRREYDEHRHTAPDGETGPPLPPDQL